MVNKLKKERMPYICIKYNSGIIDFVVLKQWRSREAIISNKIWGKSLKYVKQQGEGMPFNL